MKAALGAALLAFLILPWVRHATEAGMSLHMLVQFPALLLAGALLGTALPAGAGRRLSAWNALGVSGLATCALVLAVLMIPRILDLALVDPWVEAAKFAALLLSGAVLRPSWRRAGRAVQAFFMGNVLPMTFVAGTLYQESALRLCNAYRLEDQQHLGLVLTWGAGLVGALWLAWATWHLVGPAARGGRTNEPA